MRSSPANASLTCVPMAPISMTGAARMATKATYMTRSPSVMVPPRMARPPNRIISPPTAPMITVANAVMAEVPVIERRTLANSRATPSPKRCPSRSSMRYALTTRMPPRVSARRPVTSALSWPRSRKMGRSREKASAIAPPNSSKKTRMAAVSCQLR